jgi:mono/diheme cytochrome c family protein
MTAMRLVWIAAALMVAVNAAAYETYKTFNEAYLIETAVSAAGGAARFDTAGCRSCHRVGPRGGDSGPDLTLVGVRRPRAWIENWLKSPRAWKNDTKMPDQGLSNADRRAIAAFLSEQMGQAWDHHRPWSALPATEKGHEIYVRAGCIACHGVAGRGGHPNPGAHGDIIPALAPLMGTYTPEELKVKIRNGVIPDGHEGMSPAVVMPAWNRILNDDDLNALTAYLLSLAGSQPKSDW